MAFDPNKITYFAQTDSRGKNARFGIKAKDRQRHMYVIGKTGMGKSTLLENMAVQDIQNGEGMAFIDPHGSAAETLLNYIPEHRINDVLYFAPFDTGYPVSFNIMEDVGEDKRHLVVSGLMSVFKKIWIDAWSARMEYILSNTLLALLEYPDSTLLGVNRMLSDKDYRKLVVDNVKDPGVRAFWVDEFAKYNERYMQEAGDAIKNKIGQFTANPIIRNIIGQPKSSFNIRQIMDEKKILIMNLSKGLIGESNANLLGSMLTTRIYLAAMSRADLSPEKMREMPNFYFFVDEFQSFANATFANILSEARKYHLNLTIAHQYITQMEEEVRDAVFGNVGTIVSFRVGPFDAEVLETIFTPQFLATDIVNLSFAQVYLTLMIDGIGSQPFSATTLPPIAPPLISYKEVAIAASRKKFTRLRAEVEADIHKFHEPVVVPRKVVEKPLIPHAVVTAGNEARVVKRDASAPISTSRATSSSQRPVSTEVPKARDVPRRVTEKSTLLPERRSLETPRMQKPFVRPITPEIPKESFSKKDTQVQPSPRPEDLRDVLKRIASTARDNSVKSRTPEKGNEKNIDSGEKQDLKNAVQAALHNPVVSKSVEQKKSEENTEHVLVHSEEKPLSSPVPTVETQLPPPSLPQSTQSTQDTITPKELERMMRVTISDKPPS